MSFFSIREEHAVMIPAAHAVRIGLPHALPGKDARMALAIFFAKLLMRRPPQGLSTGRMRGEAKAFEMAPRLLVARMLPSLDKTMMPASRPVDGEAPLRRT